MKIRLRDRSGTVYGYTVENASRGVEDYGLAGWLKQVMFETAGKHPDFRVVLMEVPSGPRVAPTGPSLLPGAA